MSDLQDVLGQLDVLVTRRSTKDEAIELILRALHLIASDHKTLKSKVGTVPFSASATSEATKGGMG